jgi:hypothetical protein
MVHYLEFIKAICKQSNMWELYNPRVIGTVHNIIKCIQQETALDRKAREFFINVVLSNLIIFGKYEIGEDTTT